MLAFHRFLPAALKRRGLSPRAASLKIGRSPPYLSTVCREAMEPTMGVLVDLANLMEISLDDLVRGRDPLAVSMDPGPIAALHSSSAMFAAYAARHAREALAFRADEPNLEDFIAWYMSHNGNMSDLGRLDQFIDVYDVPDPGSLYPVLFKMGPKSLAARTIGNPSTARLKSLLALSPPMIRKMVVSAHTKTHVHGIYFSPEKIDFPIDNGDRVSLRYFRALFRGKSGRRTYILNFSKVIV